MDDRKQTKPAYKAPRLTTYGGMTAMTAGGSGKSPEETGGQEIGKQRP